MISFKQVAALYGAFALMTPAPALAEWVQVGSNYKMRTYIETDSISHRGREVFFINRSLYIFPQGYGEIAALSSSSVDCLTGTRARYRLVGFNVAGQVVFDENQGVSRAKAAPPDSIGASIYDFVCR